MLAGLEDGEMSGVTNDKFNGWPARLRELETERAKLRKRAERLELLRELAGFGLATLIALSLVLFGVTVIYMAALP
jgi:hypothetical protein